MTTTDKEFVSRVLGGMTYVNLLVRVGESIRVLDKQDWQLALTGLGIGLNKCEPECWLVILIREQYEYYMKTGSILKRVDPKNLVGETWYKFLRDKPWNKTSNYITEYDGNGCKHYIVPKEVLLWIYNRSHQ